MIIKHKSIMKWFIINFYKRWTDFVIIVIVYNMAKLQ